MKGVNVVNGVTIVNGKPFFPFGIYHVSWKSTEQELMRDLRDIAASGFNTIHASANDINNYGKFLDEADRLGVYVISEQGIGLTKFINAFKQKPAILGWNIADDVDNGKLTPQEILKFHQEAKLADPQHITYISGYSNKITKFGNCADVVAMQSYPIGNGDAKISSTYDRVSLTRDAVEPYQKAVYANVQAFAWPNKKQGDSQPARIPTFDEVRNMTYQSLLAGAKGIIYFTYYENEFWHLPSHPDLWAGIKTLGAEIKEINSLLLDGILHKINLGVEKVIAGTWTYRDQALIVVVNQSDERKKISIAMPKGLTQLKQLFEDRSDDLALNGNQLSGFLKPLDVKVYQGIKEI
jgi:hypothetical protein